MLYWLTSGSHCLPLGIRQFGSMSCFTAMLLRLRERLLFTKQRPACLQTFQCVARASHLCTAFAHTFLRASALQGPCVTLQPCFHSLSSGVAVSLCQGRCASAFITAGQMVNPKSKSSKEAGGTKRKAKVTVDEPVVPTEKQQGAPSVAQPKSKKLKKAGATDASKSTDAAPRQTAAAKGKEILKQELPVAAKGNPKKRGKSKLAAAGGEKVIECGLPDPDNFVLDDGVKVLLPPEHGRPISKKNANDKAEQQPERVELKIYHKVGDDTSTTKSNFTVAFRLNPARTLRDLKLAIYERCEVLPFRAQRLFVERDSRLVALDKQYTGDNTLTEAGLGLPGPHNVLLEVDVRALVLGEAGLPLKPKLLPGSKRRTLKRRLADAQEALVLEEMRRKEKGPASNADAFQIAEEEASPDVAGPSEKAPTKKKEVHFAVAKGEADPRSPSSGTEGKALQIINREKDDEEDEDEDTIRTPIAERRPSPKKGERRDHVPWSYTETNNLLLGMMKLNGTGRWMMLKKMFDFELRTNSDLSDKWRTIVKCVQRGKGKQNTLPDALKGRAIRVMQQLNVPLGCSAPLAENYRGEGEVEERPQPEEQQKITTASL